MNKDANINEWWIIKIIDESFDIFALLALDNTSAVKQCMQLYFKTDKQR